MYNFKSKVALFFLIYLVYNFKSIYLGKSDIFLEYLIYLVLNIWSYISDVDDTGRWPYAESFCKDWEMIYLGEGTKHPAQMWVILGLLSQESCQICKYIAQLTISTTEECLPLKYLSVLWLVVHMIITFGDPSYFCKNLGKPTPI